MDRSSILWKGTGPGWAQGLLIITIAIDIIIFITSAITTTIIINVIIIIIIIIIITISTNQSPRYRSGMAILMATFVCRLVEGGLPLSFPTWKA